MMGQGQEPAISPAMAERVKVHLDAEERSLIAVLEAVRELHRSLRQLDGAALQQALQYELAALMEARQMQERRQKLRFDAANELGLSPHEFTLGMLAKKSSGELQQSVVASRQKLSEMAAEMDRLNRQNHAMADQSTAIIRGIVSHLTGTAGQGESYTAGGVRDEAHVGSLVNYGG
ncbi:MAG: flagellar export chaperone FlgN [Planctomycetaceae bacterium]